MKNYLRCRLLGLIPAIIFLLLPEVLFAAGQQLNEMDSYFRVLWGLMIVLAIILILFGLLKKRFSIFQSSASQTIKVLELRPIMPKKTLCLVEVKGVEYLLGISNESITHIATIQSKQDSSFAATLERTVPDIAKKPAHD